MLGYNSCQGIKMRGATCIVLVILMLGVAIGQTLPFAARNFDISQTNSISNSVMVLQVEV